MNGITHLHTARAERPERVTASELRIKKADDKAVASFVLGLLGLFVFNLVLGPLALILSATAVSQGTTRRGRALLGAVLGAADLIILATLIASNNGVSWHPGV
ncbi:DUF4190 domain-containing protein [Wenjunlia tyrosinilytica]|uniref:DUF4190 domain-containing protein n=1 Tax=Wenjunlia tyrosinilytica TaxID=1544741 RepID=A0A917ZN04_9ACTN|nr:DUF4190 domain-containing protein [Wenjunlia tyrosinilytica]GGO85377.1 hypothetical protein GCM10012280_19010 [Wenjunlia tyrosinilytica]